MEYAERRTEAAKALLEGRSRDAVQVFKELVEASPNDIRLQERLGDMLRLDGQEAAAGWTFRAIASHWEEAEFFLRAVVVYKKLLEMTPESSGMRVRLADIYARLNLHDKAREQYVIGAKGYASSGRVELQLNALRAALEIRPTDVQVRLLCARTLATSAGARAEASELLRDGMQRAREDSDAQAFLQVAGKYLELEPEDAEIRNQVTLLRITGGRAAVATPTVAVSASPVTKHAASRKLSKQPFSLSSEVLLDEPEHVLSRAIRARRFGDPMEALSLLGEPEVDDYPYASIYERALTYLDLGQYSQAEQGLDMLAALPSLSMKDRELVWFHLGVVCEAMSKHDAAYAWFQRIDATSAGTIPEVAERLARTRRLTDPPK